MIDDLAVKTDRYVVYDFEFYPVVILLCTNIGGSGNLTCTAATAVTATPFVRLGEVRG